MDLKDSQEQLKEASTPEGPEAGQTFGATSRESGPSGDVQTVRASVFENVVERHSVLMVDEGKPLNKAKDSLSSPSFKRGNTEDEGTLVMAVYKEPVSPSSPLRVLHAFDTVQAVEESRAVSENIPSAQREDKAMTLRSRRSEGSRPVAERTGSAQSEPASAVMPDQPPRYLRVGALQKWTATGLEQDSSMEKGMLKDSPRERQVALDKSRDRQREAEQEEVAAAPKRLKMLQAEEQPKPRATYFALTGQMQEPVSPVDAGASIGDMTGPFDDFSLRAAPGSSQGKILPIRRNPSLDEAFGKTSQDQVEDLLMRSHMSHGEIRSALEGQTTDEMMEVEKKREPKKETERHQAKMIELEREKQRQLDMEKEAHLEFARMKEREMQREFERQRQKAFEKEKRDFEEQQRALERQKQIELEKQRLQELEREKQRELERERQRQLEKEKQRELERQRKLEREKLREQERERQRQREEERQRELDKERQRLEIQKEKQKLEELERIKELERQQLLEFQKQKQKEKERQQLIEMEKQRLREKMEREEAEKIKQMALEQEMLRIKELDKERERQREMEHQREIEREKQRALERQRQRDLEKERQRQLDFERQELENQRLRQREQEKERQRKEEMERIKEMERRQLLEFQKQQKEDRQQLVEMEKQRLREKMEREEAEKIKQMALEQEMLRMKELDKERERQREMEKERQRAIEREKQKQAERERQQVLELEKRRLKEKMEREEAEKMRQIAKQQEAERQRLKERQKKEEQERMRLEASPLRPKVVDLDTLLRNDPFSKPTSQRSDPTMRWKEPSPRAEESYKPAILDIDSFTSQAQLSPCKDLFPVSGVDAGFGARLQPTPERDISWKVPAQTSVGFTSPAWATSPQDPWELRPVEMSVDMPTPEPRKQAVKISPEQLLLRQEERLLAPQRPWSAVLDETLHLAPFPRTESKTGGSPGGVPSSTSAEQIWFPREPQPQDSRGEVRSHRRSQGSQVSQRHK